jgi:TRAP-type C4-dicarboxylate transport system permease small subunit
MENKTVISENKGGFIKSTWNRMASITGILEKLGSYVLVGMVLLTSADIMLRRFFDSPFPFTYEVTEYLLVVVAWSYIAFTTSKGRHVSVDTLTSHFPKNVRRVTLYIGDFITVILLALICWQNVLQGMNVYSVKTTSAILHIPKYPFQYWVAFAAALACLMFLFRTLNSILGGNDK